MAYEIPQEIQYKEIIAFGLNWKQLLTAFFTIAPAFFILIKNPYVIINQASSAIIALIGAGLMFLDIDKKIKTYLSYKRFRKVKSEDKFMKKYLNIKEIKDDVLILKSKEKGFSKELSILQIEPLNITMKSELEREGLGIGFQKFLNGLDFPVQFLITTNKENNTYRRNFYLIIPKIKDLELQTNFVIKRLKEIGLKARILKKSGIISVFNEFFKETNTEVKFEELEKDYTHYLLSPNKIENYKTYLKQDDTYCRVISAVGYPRSVEFGFLNRIIKLQKDIDISIHVEPFSIEKLTIKLNHELKKQLADLYTIKNQGSTNPALEIKHADTRKVLEDLQKGEEKLFLISLYVNCKGQNLKELDEITQTVIGELNSLLIVPEIPKYLQAQAFKSCLPFCQNLLEHKRNITTKPLSAFFPFTSKFYTEDENGILFGENENKLPVKKDIFKLPNHNGVILASSGGGKSYLAKLLVQRFHKKGEKVFIIDPEGEYKKTVEEIGGQVITIGMGGKNHINPLDLMGHSYETKRLALHEIFYLMFTNLGDLQRSALDDATSKVYEKYLENTENNPFPKLEDIYKVLKTKQAKAKSPPDKSMYAALTFRLSVFVNGAFKFLNKNTNIDLEKNLVCFHLKDLPSVIQPVTMYLIMDFLYNKMRKTEGRKILFVDEAWSLINKTDENSFLFKIIKTCRKHEMGVFLISQEVEDLLANKVGKAVLANSSTTILLKQKPNVIKQLNEVFSLNKEEKSLLLNADIGNSIMIFDDFREPVKITSTEEEHKLITTKPQKEKEEREDAKYFHLLARSYHKIKDLKKDQQDYLLDQNYVVVDAVPVGKIKSTRFVVKLRNREGPESSFIVHNLADFIKSYGLKVEISETSNPDIIFELNGQEWAVEVETGSNIRPDVDRTLEKLKELVPKFDNRILFVLTDSRYNYHYQKYIAVFNRQSIVKYLKLHFEAKKAEPARPITQKTQASKVEKIRGMT
ncbi:ATP-binding protein [Candidatus Woesearchaeota archaeon]|nr:ATP-binding protein [Candidatus Woesearchaeota archaeon]